MTDQKKDQGRLFHAKLFVVKEYYSVDVQCRTPQEAEEAITALVDKKKLPARAAGPDEYVVMVKEKGDIIDRAVIGKRPPLDKIRGN
jgi:hypothetical protein